MLTDPAAAPLPSVELNDGTSIPQLGFGVYKIEQEAAARAVSAAVDAGYRHVDTAGSYGNETQVGEAVRAAEPDVYVTTKYFQPSAEHGHDDARAGFRASLDRLGLDRIDLYLVHWPVTAGDGFVESWRALTELRSEDSLRSIGVSNFTSAHLAAAIDATGVTPTVNQIELHPYFQQRELRREHAERGIATEAWGPLGQGGELLEDPVLTVIADSLGKTVPQVVLRWHLQLGNIVLPKSVTPSRIRDNIAVFDFELSDEQLAAIAELDRPDGRIGPDPATFQFPLDTLEKRRR